MIENLPNCHKDKKENLLNLEECRKQEKDKKRKEKTKKIDIKPVSLQDLMTKAKMIKQEIKEDNSTNINKQNIAEIINLKEFSNPIDRKFDDNDDDNRQNFLSLIDRVIFQKWHT